MYSVFLIWNQGLSKRVQSTFRLDLSDGSLPFKRDKQNYFCRVFQLLWECWQQGWTGQSFFLRGGARQGKKSSGRGGVGARQGSKSSGRGGAKLEYISWFRSFAKEGGTLTWTKQYNMICISLIQVNQMYSTFIIINIIIISVDRVWFSFCPVNAPQFWSLPWDGAGQPVFPRGGASIPGWQPHIMPGRRPTSPSEATSRFSLRQPQSWWADDDTPITQNEKLKLFTTCPNSGL